MGSNMTKAQHTPLKALMDHGGNWCIEIDDGQKEHAGPYALATGRRLIAVVESTCSDPEYYAHFLAASPALLSACKEAFDFIVNKKGNALKCADNLASALNDAEPEGK